MVENNDTDKYAGISIGAPDTKPTSTLGLNAIPEEYYLIQQESSIGSEVSGSDPETTPENSIAVNSQEKITFPELDKLATIDKEAVEFGKDWFNVIKSTPFKVSDMQLNYKDIPESLLLRCLNRLVYNGLVTQETSPEGARKRWKFYKFNIKE